MKYIFIIVKCVGLIFNSYFQLIIDLSVSCFASFLKIFGRCFGHEKGFADGFVVCGNGFSNTG